ncbi:hypothetical protein BD560DRAFT_383128 [Blakeslea trispora]|nr:hypothetical protein BD560DRAFT_383128 [Blakeslea trispora]
MVWLICLIGQKLPLNVTSQMHQLSVLYGASYNNPYLGSSNSDLEQKQKDLVYVSHSFFTHLLDFSSQHKQIAISSVTQLLCDYLDWIRQESFTTDLHRFTLSYILFLPKTLPALFEESWPDLFRLLHENAGTLFDFERTHQQSMIRIDNTVQPVAAIFPLWLKTIAFEQNGVFMQHAIDVAIMLDTLIHDPRLNLKHLVPTGDGRSLIDTLKPSFEQLDLKPPSIDLIQWAISLFSVSKNPTRGTNDLQIPLFLLQLEALSENKQNAQMAAIHMLVQLITRIDQPTDEACAVGIRYLILHLVSSAETKWPGSFQLVLENIFSKAIAMHIVDNEGSVNIEKILSNLAMLFGSTEQDKPGFSAFQQYIVSHWRQVSLLFLNHPSIECRVMGYRHVSIEEYSVVSKLLMDAWFRHMKGRYVRSNQQDEMVMIEEQQKLISQCCQNIELAKVIGCFAMDCILGGALEIFPSIDTTSIQLDRQSLLDQITQPTAFLSPSQLTKPPQFLTVVQLSRQSQRDMRDLIYTDNIQRTASLFEQLPSPVSEHLLARLSQTWQPKSVALSSYDDVLPFNLPHQSDIVIGSAFKDHPILFLIFQRYDHAQTRDMIRGVLVYFVVFWHMKEVAIVPTTLSFATQLEETTRLILLLKPVLPSFLVNTYHLFPFMAAKDLGDILFRVIWYYFCRSSSQHIPGIKAQTKPENDSEELNQICRKRLLTICEHRSKALEKAPQWHKKLSETMKSIDLL